MKKIIFSLLVAFTISTNAFAAGEPGPTWWGQNGVWSHNANNELICDGSGGPNNWIASTFGTTQPWTDLTVKFGFYMPNTQSQNLIWQFGQAAGDWANGGVKINIGYWGVFAYDPGYANQVLMFNSNGGAAYNLDGWNTAEININATGVFSIKINGVSGGSTFTVADIATLNNTFCSVNYNYAPGVNYRMRNVELTKGVYNKKYFFPFINIAATSNDEAKGTVTGAGAEYEVDGSVSLVATPTTGNKFVNWTEGGTEVSTNATYTFTATAARTLVANFVVDPSTGLNSSKNTNLSVYPSPSKGDFTIASDAIGRKFNVTNILGQSVKSGIISSSSQKLDLTNESAGNYFVTIEGENGKVVKSIIKN